MWLGRYSLTPLPFRCFTAAPLLCLPPALLAWRAPFYWKRGVQERAGFPLVWAPFTVGVAAGDTRDVGAMLEVRK
jgi:hypothetical protein